MAEYQRQLKRCHDHLPSVFQAFGFWFNWTAVTCCICKRHVEGWLWFRVVKKWNRGAI